MITSVTQYLKPVMPDKIEATIEDFRTLSSGMEFDTVVSSGFSGGMLLPLLGYRLGLKYALVRKEGWLRDSHADKELEGQLGSRWLFVDDLVLTGATFARCAAAVTSLCQKRRHPITFAGGVTYFYHETWTPFELMRRHGADVATEYPATQTDRPAGLQLVASPGDWSQPTESAQTLATKTAELYWLQPQS